MTFATAELEVALTSTLFDRSHMLQPELLVVIDAGVEDHLMLAANVVADAKVVILQADRDGVKQITEALRRYPQSSLHIVSHGAPGCLFLGNSQLSLESIESHAAALQSWSISSLLLYGCNVAAGDAGAEFVEKLHCLTGANIAASSTLTGSTKLGGNWLLDVQTAEMSIDLAISPAAQQAYAAVLLPSLNASGTTNANASDRTIVDADLTVTGAAGETIDGARVSIGTGFSGSDRLGIQGQGTATSGSISGTNITWSYDTSKGILTLDGVASIAAYQTALRSVAYFSVGTTSGSRSIDFSLGKNVANPGNEHFYEFVSASGISWTAARDAAAQKRYFGLEGYLTTVTSSSENAFIASKLSGQGWMGASDVAVEGEWFWVTGPESGQQFWQGGPTGSSPSGGYVNWAGGEPNNAGNEDYAHFLPNATWNDYPVALPPITGYVVEYGGMPNDPTLILTGSVALNIQNQSTSPSNLALPSTAANDTGISQTDRITSNTRPTITGQAAPGSTIQVFANGNLLGSVQTAANGSWTLTSGQNLANGNNVITARATSSGSTQSADSSPLTITIDTTAPTAPAAPTLDPNSDSAPAGDNITTDTTPTITGTGTAGDRVTIFADGNAIGAGTVGANGTWSITASNLAPDSYSITARFSDAAGNQSAVSPALALEISDSTGTSPTTPPTFAVGSLTNINKPPVTGTGTAGDTIEVFVGNTSLGRTTVDNAGNWSLTPQDPLADGAYDFTYRAINPAGQSSGRSPQKSVTIDTKAATTVFLTLDQPVRDTSVDALSLRFSEPVSGVELSDLRLTLDGKPVSLEGATLTSTDSQTWVLGNIPGITQTAGNYEVSFQSGGITDAAGNAATLVADTDWLTGYTAEAVPAQRFRGGKKGMRMSDTLDRGLLRGGRNRDVLNGGRGRDRLFGGGGNDRLLGGTGSDRLVGGGRNDRLIGGGGRDRLFGGGGNDRLLGSTGGDRLVGGRGNDVLNGGAGNDVLTGRGGKDTFVFNGLNDASDTIVDFKSGEDVIDLRGIFQAEQFSGNNRFARYQEFVRLEQVGTNTEIRIDSDGKGVGTAFTRLATLQNVSVSAIASTDFAIG